MVENKTAITTNYNNTNGNLPNKVKSLQKKYMDESANMVKEVFMELMDIAEIIRAGIFLEAVRYGLYNDYPKFLAVVYAYLNNIKDGKKLSKKLMEGDMPKDFVGKKDNNEILKQGKSKLRRMMKNLYEFVEGIKKFKLIPLKNLEKMVKLAMENSKKQLKYRIENNKEIKKDEKRFDARKELYNKIKGEYYTKLDYLRRLVKTRFARMYVIFEQNGKIEYIRLFEKTVGNNNGNSVTNRVFHSFLNNNEDKGKEMHMKLHGFFKSGIKYDINKNKLRKSQHEIIDKKFNKIIANTVGNKIVELPKGEKVRSLVKKMQNWENKKGKVTFSKNISKFNKNLEDVQFGEPIVVEENTSEYKQFGNTNVVSNNVKNSILGIRNN